jgi:hypothetical protein
VPFHHVSVLYYNPGAVAQIRPPWRRLGPNPALYQSSERCYNVRRYRCCLVLVHLQVPKGDLQVDKYLAGGARLGPARY